MKKILLVIISLLAHTLSANAQTLYGTTYYGGSDGGGTIQKFLPATNNLIIAKSFESIDANPDYTTLMQASDGKLYGTTGRGGSNDDGVIFSFDPVSSTYLKVKDFDGVNGSFPSGNLIQASNGNLYGVTISGGVNNVGVIYSFDISSSTITKLLDFDGSNGRNPVGGLIQAKDGKLYGMTQTGVFSFDLSSFTLTQLRSASYPYGNLIQATDGKLYGMAYGGGSNGAGEIFSIDPMSSTYTILKSFDNAHGNRPYGSLLQATDGKLYGMTYYGANSGGVGGYGVIFSFDINSSTYTELKDFDNINGANPKGSLVQAADGKLYGMTSVGGSNDVGVIFSFDPAGNTYSKLLDFNNTNGATPSGSLLLANDGKLYGMTPDGGRAGIYRGVIFSFDPLTSTHTKLKDFGTNTNGSNTSNALIQAGNGKLYGMTFRGGTNGYGVIFSVEPSTSAYTKLKDFDNTNGGFPFGSLIQANDGKLYGMTNGGGSNGYGVIFSFDPLASNYTKLIDFNLDDINIGGPPFASLMQATDGKLYGMVPYGGSSFVGIIFSFDPSTYTYTKLLDFDNTNGSNPNGNLIQGSDGKLYGMTAGGGSNGFSGVGVIFSFDPLSSTYTILKEFDNTNGAAPLGSLIQASDGKLYGMTSNGGSDGYGVIFSFDPLSSIYSILKNFDYVDGANPRGTLMQASDGKLYGRTESGGNGYGVVFSFDPLTSTYTKLQDLDQVNGPNPTTNSAFIEVISCSTDTTYYKDADADGFGNPDSSLMACSQPAGYVKDSSDCNDSNASIHAGVTFYRDADDDGFGNHDSSISFCGTKRPKGYVKNNFDCDDHFKANSIINEKLLMCNKGKEECVRLIFVLRRLFEGWKLGSCFSGTTSSDSAMDADVLKTIEIFGKEGLMPQQFRLSNYPNPFIGKCTIKYELPFDSKVSIRVYDIMGRVVATLVDEDKKAGIYTVDFKAVNGGKISLYYKIIAKSKDRKFEQTNKMIGL